MKGGLHLSDSDFRSVNIVDVGVFSDGIQIVGLPKFDASNYKPLIGYLGRPSEQQYINPAPSIVVHGDKLVMCWFNAVVHSHWSCGRLRRDGFVSYEAADEIATLVSSRIASIDEPLHLRVNTRCQEQACPCLLARVHAYDECACAFVNGRCQEREAGGQLAVQLVDPTTVHAIHGYSFDESVLISGDSVCHNVSWKLHKTLPAGREFRIAFRFRNCELFSFRAIKNPN